jgi:hypothetical protein
MALGWGLTSERGNRGENYENEPLVRQKHIKKKKFLHLQVFGENPDCFMIFLKDHKT